MANYGFPELDIAGEPYELGFAHGKMARELIAHNLAMYFRRFRMEAGLSRAEVLRRALFWKGIIRTQSPDYEKMLEGLADGAKLPLLPLVALNVRYEILYSEFVRQGLTLGECTAVAVLPPLTQDGHLLLAENWDWIPKVSGLWLRIRFGDLLILAFTEAGVVGGKIGLNSAGVGLAINGLVSDLDRWDRKGKPFHVCTWEILTSSSLAQAIHSAEEGEMACSANFLVAQGELAIDIERAPTGTRRISPTQGLLVHANHFLDLKKLGIRQPLDKERQSTYLRQARLTELLAEIKPIDINSLQASLRDHVGFPNSICRHPDVALPVEQRYQTALSLVMDLHAHRIWYTAGPPCQSSFHELLSPKTG